jgi:hypothetical protein
MMDWLAAVLLAAAISEGQTTMNATAVQRIDTLSGASFVAVQSAIELLRPRRPDIAHSSFEVRRRGAVTLVILAEPTLQGRQSRFGVAVEQKTELSPDDIRSATAGGQEAQVVDRLTGEGALAIQAATVEFAKRYPADLANYNIEVLREGDVLKVLFDDRDLQPGTKGSGARLGFAVELDANDRSVRRWQFVR